MQDWVADAQAAVYETGEQQQQGQRRQPAAGISFAAVPSLPFVTAATSSCCHPPCHDLAGNLDKARARLAAMLHCGVDEVGLTGHTSDGLNIAAHLLDCDCVVFDDEFSSGCLAWMNTGWEAPLPIC